MDVPEGGPMEVSRILKRPAGSDIESVKIRPHNGGVCALHAGGDVCPLQAGPGGLEEQTCASRARWPRVFMILIA